MDGVYKERPQSIKHIDNLLEKLDSVKKVADINAVVRELKQVLQDSISDIKIERKYTKFIRREQGERLKEELELMKRQRDTLML